MLLATAQAAEPLKVMYGMARPPFVDDQTGRGIAPDLMDEALRRMGQPQIRRYGAVLRVMAELKAGQIDVGVEVQPDDKSLFYSGRFSVYRNFAISRDGQAYPDWASMAGKAVCAWQGARISLGDAFVSASKGFGRYQEFPDQRKQVLSWLNGACDLLLIDEMLFHASLQGLARLRPQQVQEASRQLRLAPLPQGHELWWHVGFRDAALRDAFDATLAAMKADGSYERIREHYRQLVVPAAHAGAGRTVAAPVPD
ncbi:substrate-binding periplasmic protein [Chitinilyticum litopenaei]|uniref:substrate-binding periplasmic protein n=1 Tax=Chitinilyticum litopenaei TaxID=1121276 RepID=UPI00040018FA|nr:transporter substrate-binding domain-containing protein [Chitinilyticum litopenaei]